MTASVLEHSLQRQPRRQHPLTPIRLHIYLPRLNTAASDMLDCRIPISPITEVLKSHHHLPATITHSSSPLYHHRRFSPPHLTSPQSPAFPSSPFTTTPDLSCASQISLGVQVRVRLYSDYITPVRSSGCGFHPAALTIQTLLWSKLWLAGCMLELCSVTTRWSTLLRKGVCTRNRWTVGAL